MSVQNESLELHKQPDRGDELPRLEYRSVSHDSLSMFLAAVGGAILGILLTLLILAIINGGTLNFTTNTRISAMEATISGVNENVGTLSNNLDQLSAEYATVRGQLLSAQASLMQLAEEQSGQRAEMAEQLGTVNQAIISLDATRTRFDTFVDGLSQALQDLESLDESQPTAEDGDPGAADPAATETAAP
jgi:ABC-type transporter Mla subunit MlaD